MAPNPQDSARKCAMEVFSGVITLLFILGSFALGIYYLLCKPRHFYLNVKVLSAEGAIRQKMKHQQLTGGHLAHKIQDAMVNVAKHTVASPDAMSEQLQGSIVDDIREKTSAQGMSVSCLTVFANGPFFVISVTVDKVNLRRFFEKAPEQVVKVADTLPNNALYWIETTLLPRFVARGMVNNMGRNVTAKLHGTGVDVEAQAVSSAEEAPYFFTQIAQLES